MSSQFLKGTLNSPLLKFFGILMSGTLVAQGIGYAIAPILTRLYDPSEIGELGLFVRITSFIAAIATLRYELAIPLPKEEHQGFTLYKAASKIAFFIALFCVLVFASLIITNVTPGFDWKYVVLTLLGSLSIIVINLGTNWSIRVGAFAHISRQKIVNSLFGNGLKWLFGVFSMSYMGLILATVIGYALSSLEFIKQYFAKNKLFKTEKPVLETKELLRKYKDFPLLNLPHVVVDNGRDMLVAAIIFSYFSDSIFGSFSHSYVILRIPVMLVGVSLGQIFYNQVSQKVNANLPIMPFAKKTIMGLFLLSLAPFTFLFFFGEEVFSFVFGSNWSDSGRFSEIMSFWLMANFLVSPISALPLILNQQKTAFLLGIVGMLLQVIPLWVVPLVMGNEMFEFEFALNLISYGQGVWLLFSLFVYFRFIKSYDEKVKV